MSDPGGTLLTIVSNRAEAEILCATLRENGIKCGYVQSEAAAGIVMITGGAPDTGPVDVFVEDEKLEEARTFLPADS